MEGESSKREDKEYTDSDRKSPDKCSSAKTIFKDEEECVSPDSDDICLQCAKKLNPFCIRTETKLHPLKIKRKRAVANVIQYRCLRANVDCDCHAVSSTINLKNDFKIAFGTLGFKPCVNVATLDQDDNLSLLCKVPVKSPVTKTIWVPDVDGEWPELLAVSGDVVRIFRYKDGELSHECNLTSVLSEAPEETELVRCFDWNPINKKIAVIENSGSCHIWSLKTKKLTARIAIEAMSIPPKLVSRRCFHRRFSHLCFGSATQHHLLFTSNAYGLIESRDLRSNTNREKTIICNLREVIAQIDYAKVNPYNLAVLCYESRKVVIFDIRIPQKIYLEYNRILDNPTCFSWSPTTMEMAVGAMDGLICKWSLLDIDKYNSECPTATGFFGDVSSMNWPFLKYNMLIASTKAATESFFSVKLLKTFF